MDPTAPLVAILSADRDLLQSAARTLKSHAYRVRAHSDMEALAALWEQAPADFLLIDDEHPQVEDAARLPDATPEHLTYSVALHDFRAPLENVARCEHAFHDVVSKPFRSGETLARLRAGAALLNFERQRARGRGRAPLAGMLTRAGFLHALDGHLGSAPNRQPAPLTALLAGIDAFDAHADRLSAKDVDEALRIAAELLSEADAQPRWIARCQPSALVCAWSEPSQRPLETLAEAIHSQFAARYAAQRPATPPLTWTCCVTLLDLSRYSPAAAIEQAEQQLQAALDRGGRVTVSADQLAEVACEAEAQAALDDELFLGACVRDLMAPCAPGQSAAGTTAQSDSQAAPLVEETQRAAQALDVLKRHACERLLVRRGEQIVGYVTRDMLLPLSTTP